MRMDITTGHARHSQPLRKGGKPAIARPVAPPQRPLQLDPKPSRPKAASRRRASASAPPDHPLPSVPPPLPRRRIRKGTPALRMPLQLLGTEPMVAAAPAPPSACCVALRDQPAQVGPTCRRLYEQSDVSVSAPHSTVSSVPTIGRTPTPVQACANSIAPQTLSWSVRASAS